MKCIEDEIPFDVPKGWEWVRLQSITSTLTDGTHRTPTYSDDGYIFLSSKNVTSGKIDWDNIMYIPETLHQELYTRLAPKIGDILLAKNGTTGIAAIVDKEEIFDIYVSLALIRIVENIIDPLYVLSAIGSSCIQDYFNSSLKGIGVPNLHLEHIRKTLIPIPPYSEQGRIVLRTNMLLPLAVQIEEDKKELGRLVSASKSKILDLAIRGKLVPQDPNDEPASVLLERIRAEKEELINQGKIKRDKKESIIFRGDDNSYYETINGETICIDDELPFELPEGWEWTRLQNISSILTDGTHKTPQYSDNGYIFLSSQNVTTGKIDWKNVMYIPEELHEELYNRLAPKQGDILLAKNGTTGVAAIVDSDVVFDIYVSLALIRIAGRLINSEYILNVICSSYVQEYFNKSLKGIGVPNLHLEHIRKTLIPIPPYTEQQRITKITERVSKSLDEISGILS